MFDRTDDDTILLPTRWWEHMFEGLSQSLAVDDETAQLALGLPRTALFQDVTMPDGFETIPFLAPDLEEHLVEHEAIPPGTLIRLLR